MSNQKRTRKQAARHAAQEHKAHQIVIGVMVGLVLLGMAFALLVL